MAWEPVTLRGLEEGDQIATSDGGRGTVEEVDPGCVWIRWQGEDVLLQVRAYFIDDDLGADLARWRETS